MFLTILMTCFPIQIYRQILNYYNPLCAANFSETIHDTYVKFSELKDYSVYVETKLRFCTSKVQSFGARWAQKFGTKI